MDLRLLAGFFVLVSQAAISAAPSRHWEVGELLHSEDFSSDLTQWVVEQMPGGTTALNEGRLEINDAAGCTVWFRNRMTAPVLIEYEATMIQAGGPNDNTRDLNCFWMAIDPEHPGDIFYKSKMRGGSFGTYDTLRLYYVGYGGNKNTTTRMRRYNGLGERPLLPEHDLQQPSYLITPNTAMKIQIVVYGNRTQYLRDGEVIFDFEDPQPFQQGWFGFRTVKNHMAIDNFSVYRLKQRSGVLPTVPLMLTGDYPTGYSVRQVARGAGASMHAYNDICPESPDGKRIVYFEFDYGVPGSGHVIVADRDGANAQVVSGRIEGHTHYGTRQQWIDNEHLIYSLIDEGKSVIYSLADGSSRTVVGEIDMISEGSGDGLTYNNYPPSQYKGDSRKPPEVMLMLGETGTAKRLFTKEDVLTVHPLRHTIEDPQNGDRGGFKHPKWSPDNSRFFIVFILKSQDSNRVLVKSALLADREGGNLRYAFRIGQHPMWYDDDALMSYIRREGYSFSNNPIGQDLMIHPLDGRPEYPLIKNALGIHGALSPDGTLFVTDIFDWPEPETDAILLYHVESGDYRVLVRMRSAPENRDSRVHPHPTWSRDGKHVYFNCSESGHRRLYVIDLEEYTFPPIKRRE